MPTAGPGSDKYQFDKTSLSLWLRFEFPTFGLGSLHSTDLATASYESKAAYEAEMIVVVHGLSGVLSI